MSAASTPSSRSRRPTSGAVARLDARDVALRAHERVAVRRRARRARRAPTSSRRRSIGKEMFMSRMIGTRSKPMLVWLWTMSAAGVSDGMMRYV